MKNNLLTALILSALISCNEKKEQNDNSIFENEKLNTEKAETDTIDSIELKFEDFKTEFKNVTEKASIDYDSNPNAKRYKTVITESYNEGKINFAGYYITSGWGCGQGCWNGVIIDTRDGKVYDIPTGSPFETKKESSLLISSSWGFLVGNETDIEYNYFNWNEVEKKFKFIKSLTTKRKDIE